MNKCRPKGLFYVFSTNQLLCWFDTVVLHYECRRHDTPAKPRVEWGQSPIWNPGYIRTKSNIELRRSGTITRAFVLRFGSAAPLGLNKCVSMLNPGLAPRAMQGYRPYRALLSKCVVLTWVFTCTYRNEYIVLTSVFTRTYFSEYVVLKFVST